jgi:hypothetical protein
MASGDGCLDALLMNSKSTWISLIVAAGLFAFIFLFERHLHKPASGPTRIFPDLKAAAVTTVQVTPGGRGQLEIRAEQTNGAWHLIEPIAYPAQAGAVESLLAMLEQLVPATYIPPGELKSIAQSDREFGFDVPQATVVLQQPGYAARIRVGAKTAPGDQVFLQVVGVEGVYAVDAELLKLIPQSANDWRDRTFLNLKELVFDRLAATNGAKVVELQRDENRLWRMVRPLPTRANGEHLEEALQKLQSLRIAEFVSDNPKSDLETFGLQPAELEIGFHSANTGTLLQFGKSPTNNPATVFARRTDRGTIVTVPKDVLAPWRGEPMEFRDPYLLTLSAPVEAIEIRGEDNFVIERASSNDWRVLPQDFSADASVVTDLLDNLNGMQIVQFAKDAVTAPELPEYGLAEPQRQVTLRCRSAAGVATNSIFFGIKGEKVFARHGDENSVYEIRAADFQKLPSASCHLRSRRIWDFSENDIASITVQQAGISRTVLRTGTNSWSIAPGSQGAINTFAVEETAHRLGELSAAQWVARGDQNRARYGLDSPLQVSVVLKSGDKLSVDLGAEAPSHFPYAAVKLKGEDWIFEFPLELYQYIRLYLTPAS